MQPTNSTKEKRPSYLAQAKSDLAVIVQDYAENAQEQEAMTERLWKYTRSTTVKSYWNGVEHGASGKVKPKAPDRNRPNN